MSATIESHNSGQSEHVSHNPQLRVQQLTVVDNELEEALARTAVSLPPIDRGRGAWTFLACAFTIDLILWGLPYSFGVLEEYYLSTPPFSAASEQTINAIGTIAVALMHMLLIFIIPVLTRINQLRPQSVTVISRWALGVCALSLLLASFATSAWQLVVLQGIVFGSSATLVWSPIIVYLSQWFIERRSLAAAVIFGGSGIGGAIFPPLLNYLLSHTGFRWTLRILSLIVAVGGGLSLLGLQPRVPVATVSHSSSDRIHSGQRESFRGFIAGLIPDFAFAKSYLFAVITIANGTQGLAYFTVSLYLPSYAASVGLSPLSGTLALSAFNLCGVFGQVLFGYLCDILPYTFVIMISGAGGALSAFLMWGFAGNNLALLYAFVVVFGTVCGGFTSVTAPACVDLVGTGSQSGIVLGAMDILRGIAVVIGPQLAALLRQNHSGAHISAMNEPSSTYGGYGFTAVEVFVGCGMLATSLGGGLAQVLRMKRPAAI